MKFTKTDPNETELKDIAALYIECFNAPEKGENWTPETAYDYFQERIKEGSIFATLKNQKDEIIGVCCGSDYETSFISKEMDGDFDAPFYLSLVAVTEEQQGKGHGKMMLKDYCKLAHEEGFNTMVVRCRASNMPMRHVLGSAGFQEIMKYTSELGGVTCERVVLKKTL